eukprot:gnl/TRDRNA2_/TRDRNA2_100337_c1_seq1.p1 gnl/TRDRNA2_/TRDRNA2_100337_c1~~gnl/TRDRNA2_/TRDRNA2_100337_c1_seq1.p1  ORF type:complete len:355 (-),score=94.76 gnl/TRDRNA2_/TRDRNA2_100337_c1_seq1:306-1337(-)
MGCAECKVSVEVEDAVQKPGEDGAEAEKEAQAPDPLEKPVAEQVELFAQAQANESAWKEPAAPAIEKDQEEVAAPAEEPEEPTSPQLPPVPQAKAVVEVDPTDPFLVASGGRDKLQKLLKELNAADVYFTSMFDVREPGTNSNGLRALSCLVYQIAINEMQMAKHCKSFDFASTPAVKKWRAFGEKPSDKEIKARAQDNRDLYLTVYFANESSPPELSYAMSMKMPEPGSIVTSKSQMQLYPSDLASSLKKKEGNMKAKGWTDIQFFEEMFSGAPGKQSTGAPRTNIRSRNAGQKSAELIDGTLSSGNSNTGDVTPKWDKQPSAVKSGLKAVQDKELMFNDLE